MEFYYQFLSGRAQKTYRSIEQGLRNRRKSIMLAGCFSGSYAAEIVRQVSYDHPELFYVDYSSVSYLQGALGLTYQPGYILPTSKIGGVEAALESQAEKILKKMHTDGVSSLYAKVRWIHNYLIRNLSYDYESLQLPKASAHSIQGALQEKSAVCEGIAKTFLYLCDRENIPAALVVGSADGGEAGIGDNSLHAWNLVKLGDTWYHIDPTFDLCHSQSVKANRYDYFCVSDADMMRDHVFEKKVECPSSEKSYFIQTGCLVRNMNDVRGCVQKKLDAGKRIFYFKVAANTQNVETAMNKAMTAFKDTLSGSVSCSAYRCYYNKAQGILYIKLMD